METKCTEKTNLLKEKNLRWDCCQAVRSKSEAWQSMKTLIQISLPVIITQFSLCLLNPISLVFCGHLGDAVQFDGAALAISVISCTVISVGNGMASACDTVFSQTISSNNETIVGIYLQKSIVLFSLMILPFFAFHINAEAILVYLGQHPDSAKIASDYVLIFMPGAWCFFMFLILSKYLLSMNILYPNVAITVTSNIFNAAMHYILLYKVDLGIRGSAISLSSSHALNLILVFAYIVISKCYKGTWNGWTSKCFDEWLPMVKLAISGMFMVGMEFWALELGLLLAGLLGVVEQGSQSVILQFDSLWFVFPLSIQVACTIRVGQRLGAGDIAGAKLMGWMAIILIVCISILPVAMLLGIPHQLTAVFTNIPEIISLTGSQLPIIAFYFTIDGIAGTGLACVSIWCSKQFHFCVSCGTLTGKSREIMQKKEQRINIPRKYVLKWWWQMIRN